MPTMLNQLFQCFQILSLIVVMILVFKPAANGVNALKHYTKERKLELR